MTTLIALDSETTGLDLFHGVKPYFVTTCDDEGKQKFWEWDVDPLTREPQINPYDIDGAEDCLSNLLDDYKEIVGQNIRFDVKALSNIGVHNWSWNKTHDTLIAGHLLASNRPHNLTDMCIQYLGINIEKYELVLEKACKEARRLCRSKFKEWKIAKPGYPDMPSVKSSATNKEDRAWKFDAWLPRALANEHNWIAPDYECKHQWDKPDAYGHTWICSKCNGHQWWTVLAEYANMDSSATKALWKVMRQKLHERGLWEIYQCMMELPEIAYEMQGHGVTLNRERLEALKNEYQEVSEECKALCEGIADSYGYGLIMPAGASPNDSLRHFIHNVLNLEPQYATKSKSGAPTLNKEAMAYYSKTLPDKSKEKLFIDTLLRKRKKDTHIGYLEDYERYWLATRDENIFKIHPNANQTGSDTLRWSFSNPNTSNVSTQEDEDGRSLRYVYGPAPGREWWDLDAKNIELRIPAYVAGEKDMIALFERPDDPPYYGSNHLLIAHILFPEEFEEGRQEDGTIDGRLFKKNYLQKYKRVKNGNFAVQYGAINRDDGMGTADRTYGIRGAQTKIEARFAKMTALNQKCIRLAEKQGYIETLPDRTVNPKKGYPLLCSRTEWGKILETTPLNYFVQGSACFWMRRAMIECQKQLKQWKRDDGFTGFITMQVHDSLVFDFPEKGDPRKDVDKSRPNGMKLFRTSNLWRIRRLQQLMSQCGDDIGIPVPVGATYCPESWDQGEEL